MAAALESHPNWVLWPPPYPSNTENGLLSIFSGLDWQGNREYLQFRSDEANRWKSLGFERLQNNGYLETRSRFWSGGQTQLVTNSSGDTSESALLLALDTRGPFVSGIPLRGFADNRGISVYQAKGWDDAALMARKCKGKAVALEFPPAVGTRWSRYWLIGPRWGEQAMASSPSLRLRGVVAARDFSYIFRELGPLAWSGISEAVGKPEPWFERAAKTSPLLRGIILSWAFAVLSLGVYLVRSERTLSVFRGLVLLSLGMPAIDLLGGTISSFVGLGSWIAIIPALGCLLLGGITVIDLACRNQHLKFDLNLGLVSLFGFMVSISCSPIHSDFSPLLFGKGTGPSYEALGFTGAYLVGVLLPIRSWSLRFAVTGMAVIVVLVGNGWGVDYSFVAVAPISLVSLLPITWFTLFTAALAPWLSRLDLDHLCWTPFGLLGDLSDRSGLDASAYLLEILSIPLAMTCIFASFLGLSTIGFAQHRLMVAYRNSALCRGLATLSLLFLASSLLIPGMLASALVVVVGCALVLVYVATA